MRGCVIGKIGPMESHLSTITGNMAKGGNMSDNLIALITGMLGTVIVACLGWGSYIVLGYWLDHHEGKVFNFSPDYHDNNYRIQREQINLLTNDLVHAKLKRQKKNQRRSTNG